MTGTKDLPLTLALILRGLTRDEAKEIYGKPKTKEEKKVWAQQ